MGRKQKEKGKRGERAAVKKLLEVFPDADLRRGWQTRYGGKDEPDIIGLPWHVEVAVGKAPSPHGKMMQAIRDSGGKKVPLVMTKRDHGEWLVTMRFDDWYAFGYGGHEVVRDS